MQINMQNMLEKFCDATNPSLHEHTKEDKTSKMPLLTSCYINGIVYTYMHMYIHNNYVGI